MKNGAATVLALFLVMVGMVGVGNATILNAYTEEMSFLSAVGETLNLESFENETAGDINFPYVTQNSIMLTGSGLELSQITDRPSNFDSDGEQSLHVRMDDQDYIQFLFSNPITAFGINYYHFGTVYHTSTLEFTNLLGDVYSVLPEDNGSNFLGLITDAAFTQVRLIKNLEYGDVVYFDELYYGTPVPEPSTILILGAGLIVLGVTRRKMRKSPLAKQIEG